MHLHPPQYEMQCHWLFLVPPRDFCSFVFCFGFEICLNTMCSVVCRPLVALWCFSKKNVISISINPHSTSVQLTEIHSKLIGTGLTNLTLTLCNPYPIVFLRRKKSECYEVFGKCSMSEMALWLLGFIPSHLRGTMFIVLNWSHHYVILHCNCILFPC